MITKQFPALDRAINEESYDWLWDNVPALAAAVVDEVRRGAKPSEIRRYVMQRTQRDALAARCEQAAAWAAAKKSD